MQIKTTRILLATASAVAISVYASGPASAADPAMAVAPAAPPVMERTISGTFDLFVGHDWRNSDGDDWSCSSDACADYVIGGEARVDIPFGDTMGIQIDGAVMVPGGYGEPGDSPSHWLGNAQGGLHVYSRQDRYLFGAFAGGGRTWVGSSVDIGLFFAGGEGQYHLNNNMTLYGQVGFVSGSRDDTTGQLENAIFLRGVARYFFNSGMTKAEGEVSYVSGQASGDNASMWELGAELEHQAYTFAGGNGMASIFARWEGRWGHVSDYDENPGAQRFYVGLKLNMNQSTLQGRNLYGDTLDFPDFGGWVHLPCQSQCD